MNFNLLSDKIVFNSLKLIKHGFLEIQNHDSKIYKFGNESEQLRAKIKINKPGLTLQIIKSGSVGLAEAYMRNEFETDNLTNLIEITAKNIKIVYKFSGIFDLSMINKLKSIFIKNNKSRSKKNISKHYDLGNDFFSLWLDPSLTYSSAIFEKQKDDLFSAQLNKYKKLTELIKPNVGNKILEIGCGWGGFAEYVGKNYDVKLDCITISKEQFEFSKKRIFENGLNEKVNIFLKDYRDVKDKYDSIASIEMIEAVGQNYLVNYFKSIKKNLSENGRAAIQAITIDDSLFDRYKTKEDFIQKYIFPGGFLPSKRKLYDLSSSNGLEIKKYESYGSHYSNTLKIWRDEFLKKWEEISKHGFDNKFKRMWHFYLSYCEAGFKSKNIDLIQFSMQNKI
ncbi:cyclopropane-fatty-acyl-phospholipid synthase family protein [Candidatus Pelagibacter sp.]|jgi:cyclopropane-fatty-acyl-phospholipid synthase|nr:cyclopropane-fatty-acyl-phospholipid synthase family protein [Candidatus Pelagibacter sp.]MDA9743531.1 cyclopropane-fatty-acyl-phospholipid synthase family protein [Candidatus Pelagibacter sp.]|tara:strand:- start:2927 stop:4108 length:1182 start_codon:yes stop_codon:yes gene_type:complete